LATVKYDFASGRNFSTQEVEYGNNRAIIGSDLVNKLYKGNANAALNTSISIGNVKYKVVGVLASKGSSMNQRSDRIILIPLMNAKSQYGTLESNYNVNVSVNNSTEIDEAVSMATGLMRNLRKLRATQENDFEITKSDGLIDIIKENTATIRWGVIFIAIITLLGAAIGLMNIMLVSVTERTKEIGIIKAVGATQRSILTQFLTEAVVICQIGGVLAAFLGILIGFAVSAIIKGPFIIPWNWIILAIFLCFLVGLLSGLYPALKASRLDPIESLRYE
ncbi:MAG TPA: FtsX-like permease family protein, partial [Saprospiraceae bacterium]|nr:FtsX-like permease family protein [Saprospiraceae bacterium]